MFGFCHAYQSSWTLHANLNVTPFYELRLRVAEPSDWESPDFVQLPRRGLFALLTEPLQSCNHP